MPEPDQAKITQEFETMASLSMKELLEAGVHFGHPTRLWNPKMKRYIYGARNGIYIIDLHQTLKMFDDAQRFVQEIVNDGGTVLFVGTKKQAQEAIAEAAIRCRQYYVNQRWLGGMLTNYRTIRDRVKRLQEINDMQANGILDRLTKKEATLLLEQRDKLERNLGGIKDMLKLPDCIVVVDCKREHLALDEARRLQIPVVALVDTNCDPDRADYIVPGNDDAIRAIKLITGKIADAIVEIKQSEWEVDEGLMAPIDVEEFDKPDADADGLITETEVLFEGTDSVVLAHEEDEYAKMAAIAVDAEAAPEEPEETVETIDEPAVVEETPEAVEAPETAPAFDAENPAE